MTAATAISINVTQKNRSEEEEGEKLNSVVPLEKTKSLQSYVFIHKLLAFSI